MSEEDFNKADEVFDNVDENDIVDESGKNNGEGITYFTHRVPFCTMDIPEGDTVDIFIRHNMQDNILPGIADIGVLVERIEE